MRPPLMAKDLALHGGEEGWGLIHIKDIEVKFRAFESIYSLSQTKKVR